MTEPETETNPAMFGVAPRTRKQMLTKCIWIVIWFLYLTGPIGDLAEGDLSPADEALAGPVSWRSSACTSRCSSGT